MAAAQDIYDHLESESIAGGATGWGLVRRRLHDGQDQIVVVSEDGGPQPETPRASGMGDEAVGDVGVQVMVRAGPWDGDASLAKADAIKAELHGKANATIGSTFYVRVRAMTPEPVFAGFDDSGRPIHTIAFRMLRDE